MVLYHAFMHADKKYVLPVGGLAVSAATAAFGPQPGRPSSMTSCTG